MTVTNNHNYKLDRPSNDINKTAARGPRWYWYTYCMDYGSSDKVYHCMRVSVVAGSRVPHVAQTYMTLQSTMLVWAGAHIHIARASH
jgi:hypothetical protein